MTRALVILDHGSRLPDAHAQLEEIAEALRKRAPSWRVYTAHLELASPSLEEALDACAADGIKELILHPLFLLPGRHLREDIPTRVERARMRHPALEIRVSSPLGADSRVAEWILSVCGIE